MSDLADFNYEKKYDGDKKILIIAADERYLLMDNGTFFSTGNHPVETLVPMYHLAQAGWDFEIATLSGNPVKFEFWAMPAKDERLKGFFESYATKFKEPKKLADIVKKGFDEYFALYIPGGHGALIGLDESRDVKAALKWFHEQGKYIITICHGPAGLLAAALDEDKFCSRATSSCCCPTSLTAPRPIYRLHAGPSALVYGLAASKTWDENPKRRYRRRRAQRPQPALGR